MSPIIPQPPLRLSVVGRRCPQRAASVPKLHLNSNVPSVPTAQTSLRVGLRHPIAAFDRRLLFIVNDRSSPNRHWHALAITNHSSPSFRFLILLFYMQKLAFSFAVAAISLIGSTGCKT